MVGKFKLHCLLPEKTENSPSELYLFYFTLCAQTCIPAFTCSNTKRACQQGRRTVSAKVNKWLVGRLHTRKENANINRIVFFFFLHQTLSFLNQQSRQEGKQTDNNVHLTSDLACGRSGCQSDRRIHTSARES